LINMRIAIYKIIMDSLQTKIKEVLPKEKDTRSSELDGLEPMYDYGYNQALLDVHSSIPKVIEIVREEITEELKQICNKCKTERGLARAIGNFINKIQRKL